MLSRQTGYLPAHVLSGSIVSSQQARSSLPPQSAWSEVMGSSPGSQVAAVAWFLCSGQMTIDTLCFNVKIPLSQQLTWFF